MCGTSCCPSSIHLSFMVRPRHRAAVHQTSGRPGLGACSWPLLLALPDRVEMHAEASHSHAMVLCFPCWTLSFSEVSSWKGTEPQHELLNLRVGLAPQTAWPCPEVVVLRCLHSWRCLPGRDVRPG